MKTPMPDAVVMKMIDNTATIQGLMRAANNYPINM